MTVNIGVNGMHLYRHVIGPLSRLVPLRRFYYAHRIGTDAPRLGLRADQARNIWFKEYLLNAHLRWWPPRDSARWHTRYGDLWQAAVLRDWRPAAQWVCVVGELADRVMARARADGARVVGHAVTSHAATFARLLNDERDRLRLADHVAPVTVGPRRLAEVALADHVIVMSDFARRGFASAGFAADRITIVPPGLDLDRFQPLRPEERPGDRFQVVCVGQVGLRKGQHHLLTAWRRLRLPEAELLLVGGLLREAPAILAPFAGMFTHQAHIPNTRLRAVLARASVFVLPSIEDGFAQVVAEALACGVPVITTDQTGAADLIQSGVNGFVVPAGDSAALAERIQQLHDDPDLRRRMGDAAAAGIRAADWTWEGYARRLAAVLAPGSGPVVGPAGGPAGGLAG